MSILEELPTEPFGRHALAEKFTQANVQAGEILDQNDRAVVAEVEIDDSDFLELALKGIAIEQNTTLEQLADYCNPESPNYLPYREVSLAYLALEDERRILAAEIASRTKSLEEKRAAIDSLAAASSRLAPLIEDEAKELAETKKARLRGVPIDDLLERQAGLEHESAGLGRLLSIAGTPWPVPQAIEFKSVEAEFIEQVVDEIPVPPMPTDEREAQAIAEYSERHVDAPEASKHIAYWLSQTVGEIVTVDDLIEFTYDREQVERQDTLRSRITTLLGPKVQGPRIQAMLAEDGMVLQYGWRRRRIVNIQTGESVPLPRERIYRAMMIDQLRPEDIEPFEINEAYSESEQISDRITWTENEEHTRLARNNSPVHEAGPAVSPPGPERFSGRVIALADMPQAPKSTESQEKSWQEEFRSRVDYAIEFMQRDDLMHEGGVDARTVKLKSSSTRMGTDTAFERLKKAKLISRQQAEYKILYPENLIVMYMFNSHKELLTGKAGDEAMRIIGEAVRNFFDEELERQ